ncbi:MAG TPA: nucleotide sugar dehydrogenase [Bryobacteraceae bacterium]|nr:nucleotide sugar dehydrogenase [Bryobacteraceae bacterium]HZU43572.1 nucleotide sugar dehydrogenase [Terriglobales bacterium]
MNVCVFGLWHLGSVTAACVAEHFPTVGLDFDSTTVADLNEGKPPILEPGLDQLTSQGLSRGTLRFTDCVPNAVGEADLVWVTFDTPVDEDDRADTQYVERQIASIFPHLRPGTVLLISSQMPVGSTRQLEAAYREQYPDGDVHFAYSPENLRLGKALTAFRQPERIIVGTTDAEGRQRLETLLSPFCKNLIWMSIESAEMTKHALNAFLASSIAFINEIAVICEDTGADAKHVEMGLKTDERIGPRAYLGAGGPFAGGTLARDISFLTSKAATLGVAVPLLESVRLSNNLHKNWPRRKLEALLGNLTGKRVAVLGLTYKPGTNTLRRSAAIELCRWLFDQGAQVTAFDPVVRDLPVELSRIIVISASAVEALRNCDAAVVTTEWPLFRELAAADFIDNMKNPNVLDANRFLEKKLASAPNIRYIAVGKPWGVA